MYAYKCVCVFFSVHGVLVILSAANKNMIILFTHSNFFVLFCFNLKKDYST